jgi:hypothetical protein
VLESEKLFSAHNSKLFPVWKAKMFVPLMYVHVTNYHLAGNMYEVFNVTHCPLVPNPGNIGYLQRSTQDGGGGEY